MVHRKWKMVTALIAKRATTTLGKTFDLFRASFSFLNGLSTTSSNSSSSVKSAAAAGDWVKKPRRKKKYLFEVAQFLPNWGIGYHMAKTHWAEVSYEITKINLYNLIDVRQTLVGEERPSLRRRRNGGMEIKTIAEEKSSPRRRELRLSRSGRNHKPIASSILEAISQFGAGEVAAAADGRMKIVVKKEDVKQVLEAIRVGRGWGRRHTAAPTALSLEQRLNLMRRRQIFRAANRSRRSWRPVLQSIPEEM
ncbi:hypothetical protein C2S53_005753 [Perilla frutescens var. hirtella]|uniref:Uncharacterized protein n=1 Tax=Perilla frutescens var. hirtella TaxID=608512 RepID=A0AAD4PBG5_PERFH|nr:hypothetical protein C2S53_005753 [Perilla frutescens var. hirtella]